MFLNFVKYTRVPAISFIFIFGILIQNKALISNYQMKFNDSIKIIDERNHDSLFTDTVNVGFDSLKMSTQKPKNASTIVEPVQYKAADSIAFNIDYKSMELYKTAQVSYQEKIIEADQVMFDMTKETVIADPVNDSLGNPQGKPVFTDKNEKFDANHIAYNFKTRKGFIRDVKSQQGEGYLHGSYTKRRANEHIDIKEGKYTTCDLDHPHFYIRLTKAKSIPNDKIVAGPSHLVVADIPTPLFLPFGFFPQTQSYSSGVLLPTWGEEQVRGFALRNGGYYWAASPYFDVSVQGDIYSKGSWGLMSNINYLRKYRFKGTTNLSYYKNKFGDQGSPDYIEQNDFSMVWNHSQDPKANPFRSFSASVNFSSKSYDKYNSRSLEEKLQNSKSSSINYNQRWPNKPFNLSSSLSVNQNSQTSIVNLGFPKVSLTMNEFYPFRNEDQEGETNWIQNFRLNYSANLDNDAQTYDSLLFTNKMFEKRNSGFKHSVPFSNTFKLNSFISFTPSLNYQGYLYENYTKQYFDRNQNRIIVDTIKQFSYAHSYFPSSSININPKWYGMYQFKYGKIKAIRHVLSPTASASYVPDVSKFIPDYYRVVKNEDGTVYYTDSAQTKTIKYSKYEKNRFGTPTGSKESAMINLGLGNNLEMKYLSVNDTSESEKKIVLLRNLNINCNYNVFADSMNWSRINMAASTQLFKEKLSINYSASFDPYVLNSKNQRINVLEWKQNRRIGRLTNYNISASTSFSSIGEGSKTKAENVAGAINAPDGLNRPGYEPIYADFNISWSTNLSYNLDYSKPTLEPGKYIQTFRVSGDFNLTKKWKIGYNSGFDFQNKEVSTTSFNIFRDLHCWVMTLTWVPFGTYKSYFFQINAKASLLQDLKYTKRKYWYDNF